MGLLEFNKLPINTLVGADWKTFNAITKGREIDAAYKGKFRRTNVMRSCWRTNRWSTTLYLFSVTGVAEQLSCIMCSLATSISAITQRIRPYFRI